MQQQTELNKELFEICSAKGRHSINLERVKSLLSQGADPNYSGQCDLFPNVPNNVNYTFPLLHVIAGKENSVEVAKFLIESGAKLNKVDTCIMNTPLLTAIALRDKALSKLFITKIRKSDENGLQEVLD